MPYRLGISISSFSRIAVEFSVSLSLQTLSRIDGRKGWTRKVPSRKPQLMKKWRALMKGLLFSGPRVKTNRILSAVRKSP